MITRHTVSKTTRNVMRQNTLLVSSLDEGMNPKLSVREKS